eukprot:gene7273-7115_t
MADLEGVRRSLKEQRLEAERQEKMKAAELKKLQDEANLFKKLVRDVTPLSNTNLKIHELEKPAPIARQRELDDEAVLWESISDEMDVERFLETDDKLSYRRNGYRLVRFDNRDIGLTDQHPTSMKVNVPATFIRNKLGLPTPTNYKLDTMANDAIGLIDALELKRPHLLGISMGGMISQIVAAKAPEKIGKLVTLMSSTNNPKLPMPTPNVLHNMFLKKPKSQKIDDVVAHGLGHDLPEPLAPTFAEIIHSHLS